MDKVTFKEAAHVWFDREARVLHCDRCLCEEALCEDDAQGHIVAFAGAHQSCPEVSTEASRASAKKKVYDAAFVQVFGG